LKPSPSTRTRVTAHTCAFFFFSFVIIYLFYITSWLCTRGSPCGHVPPDFPRTPEYFLLIEAIALNANQSYCAYSTTFVLRLHSINLTVEIYITIFIITLVIMFALLGLAFALVLYYERNWLQGFRRVP
jgi:hypothetical protein